MVVLIGGAPSTDGSGDKCERVERSSGPEMWRAVGYATALNVIAHRPHSPEEYKAFIPAAARVVLGTIEVHRCGG
jgi:hypothetical protein